MKRSVMLVVPLAALLVLPLGENSRATAQDENAMATTTLKVGDAAPDFTLPSDQNKPVKLSDYRGKKNVVLAFYVLAFTGG
jgi:cytochrome oxidase Cu insertion factor (SCO1/SenC/PrrC family)